jgi:hypothetical protein
MSALMRAYRSPQSPCLWVFMACAGLGLAAGPLAASPPVSLTAHEIASGLSRLGPRPDGAKTQDQAAAFLADALRRAGLRNVRYVQVPRPPALPRGGKPPAPLPANPAIVNVEGVIPGESGQEIVLSAHYDTVAPSPGAADDASGCGVVIAAAAELARTPRRHTIRVILFDGEEVGLFGSRGWIKALPQSERDRILADLNVEMVGWSDSTGPTIHAFPVTAQEGPRKGERITTPGWLVRAVLDGGKAADWPMALAEPRFSLPMQLLMRGTRVRFGADSGAFQALEIPAVTLSDSSFFAMDPTYHKALDTPDRLDAGRLDRWTQATVATVRELEGLAARPSSRDDYQDAYEDDYLVLAGSLWTGWLLSGIGIALAILLWVRHRRAPVWSFSFLLAIACVAVPVLALPLLLLPALLAFVLPARRWKRVLWTLLGLLPFLLYLLLLAAAWGSGLAAWKAGYQESWSGAALVVAALVAWGLLPGSARPRGGRPAQS